MALSASRQRAEAKPEKPFLRRRTWSMQGPKFPNYKDFLKKKPVRLAKCVTSEVACRDQEKPSTSMLAKRAHSQVPCSDQETSTKLVKLTSSPIAWSDQETPVRKRNPTIVDRPENSIKKISASDRTKEILSSLSPEFPTIVRLMLHSHVVQGFWLGIPKKFCVHLPKEDASITLEDESGHKHKVTYLQEKGGLSGGWRGFAILHKIQVDDVVIFHIIEPTKLKVYIVRSSGYNAVDESRSLHGVDLPPVETSIGSAIRDQTWKKRKRIPVGLQDEINGVTGGEDFATPVHGVVDSELPAHAKEKHDELLKSMLQKKLHVGLNSSLAAGMVSQTMKIAEDIRSSKITTPIEDFFLWRKTLEAFEDLGMDVGVLLDRLDQLINLVNEPKRIQDMKKKRTAAKQEMSKLKAKVLEVRTTIEKLDAEINAADDHHEGRNEAFRKISGASW